MPGVAGPRLRTERLELLAATAPLARLDAADERGALGSAIGAVVPDEWPPPLMGEHRSQFAEILAGEPHLAGWWHWYWVRDEGPAGRVLLGIGGFAGRPDSSGRVMLGYSVLDPFQRRGYATEAVHAMLGWAFADSATQEVVGDTFPELVASIRVMEKCGMRPAGAGGDAGSIRFRIGRESAGRASR